MPLSAMLSHYNDPQLSKLAKVPMPLRIPDPAIERLRRRLRRVESASSRATALQAKATASQAVGALAIGAIAVGALAIGALAIGRLAIGRARIRRLHIDELVVGKLHVTDRIQEAQK